MIIYRSRLNAKINRNFEVFKPTDFIAAITQHIPDKGVQMVRYYGWYSNKSRGVRQRGLPPELVVSKPGISPPPPAKLPSKKWRDVIRKVWHTDPLRCPRCGESMRVIAIIDDPKGHGENPTPSWPLVRPACRTSAARNAIRDFYARTVPGRRSNA
jgi:hypothetical protein